MTLSASKRLQDFLSRGVWQVEFEGISRVRVFFYRVARISYLVARGFFRNKIPMQAAALTYTLVLSLVPLLAIAFAVAKGFGAYDYLVETKLKPMIDDAFAPAGGVVAEGASQPASSGIHDAMLKLLEFVEKTDFRNLGMIGLLFLFLTAIRLIGTIEGAFNSIWGVARSRTFVRKLTDYIAMLVIAPMVLLAATAANGAAQSNTAVTWLSDNLHLGFLVKLLFRLVPLLVVWMGFTFMYMCLPNTRVGFRSALIGGVVGGTLWQLSQILVVKLQVGLTQYNAIYAGFAAFPVFLFWVFIGWVTVLFGAQVAWAHQEEPVFEEALVPVPTHSADREAVALRASRLVTEAFVAGKKPEGTEELARRLGVPPRAVDEIMLALVTRGLMARGESKGIRGFVPATDPSHIRVQAILDAVRGAPEDGAATTKDPVDVVLARVREVVAVSPENVTLRDLVRERETR